MRQRFVQVLVCVLLGLVPPVSAQGPGTQFLNFEAPAHKPILVTQVAGQDFLLVANVPDNSVEVFGTAGAVPNFLFRVPTGQRPITLAVRPSLNAAGGRQIYVANWLGDSVTVFDLNPNPGGPLPVTFNLVTTEPVGDEPVGIAFLPANPAEPLTLPGGPFHELVIVTSSSRGQWNVFLPGTMQPVLTGIELMQNTPGGNPVNVAVHDPRAVAFAPLVTGQPSQMWVLNHRGGTEANASFPATNPDFFDFDLWGTNDTTTSAISGFATLPRRGGLGTTNFQMSFAANGDLWVVGQRARNKDPQLGANQSQLISAVGEPVHQAQVLNETGFVTSYIARYPGGPAVTATPQFLDLNDATQGTGSPTQHPFPVTQPTDLVVVGNGGSGTRVFVTGFNSDTLAMIVPTAGAPNTWIVTRIDVAPINPISRTNPTGSMRGPRGLAYKGGAARQGTDRLFVYNRLENSVTVVNPNTSPPAVVTTFPLVGQPEPAYLVTGRKFLYSSRLSGTGTVVNGIGGSVSCASCHIDGNTDFLSWNLSDGGTIPAPGAPTLPPFPLLGALGPNPLPVPPATTAPGTKGQMFTQPLRGLVNFEVLGNEVQDLFFTNRPYHWRGDKGFLEQFNAAFVNLLGAPNLNTLAPTPAHREGLPPAQMTEYRNFVFSIHYPPNPDQPLDRVYSGDIGDPNNDGDGLGAKLGLKLFHILPTVGQRSCSHCHALPEASNNRFTEFIGNTDFPALVQNIETAQMRALAIKEKRLQRVTVSSMGVGTFTALPTVGPQAVTNEFGLTHTGRSDSGLGQGSLSINDFVDGFPFASSADTDAMALFVRQFDTGVGPQVGLTVTTDGARFNADPTGHVNRLTLIEDQVRNANSGLAVHARIAGVLRGFWFDATDPATPYHEEAQPGISPLNLNQSQLHDFVRNGSPTMNPTNLLTFHATPLGSQRRVARIQGGLAPLLGGGTPTNVVLQPARTNTANREVPLMVKNWQDAVNQLQFLFATALPSSDFQPQLSESLYQVSLRTWVPPVAGAGVPDGFGLADLRHEAPRRFRVSGTGIQEGAFLLILPPTAADLATVVCTAPTIPPGPTPPTATPPTTVPNLGTNPFPLLFPIYPATDSGPEIWETADELESLLMLALLNGGPGNALAADAFVAPISFTWFTPVGSSFDYTLRTTDLMRPFCNNWYFVLVINNTATGLQASTGSWQRLTID